MPIRRDEDDEVNDDPVRELMVVAEAIGYSPLAARAAMLALVPSLGETREACSVIMDVMLARQPLPEPGRESTC